MASAIRARLSSFSPSLNTTTLAPGPRFFCTASSIWRASSASFSSNSLSMRSFSRRAASSLFLLSSASSASRACCSRRALSSASCCCISCSCSSLRFSIMTLRALAFTCSSLTLTRAVAISSARLASFSAGAAGEMRCRALDRRRASTDRWVRTRSLSSCWLPKCRVPLRWSMRTCRNSALTASTTMASTSPKLAKGTIAARLEILRVEYTSLSCLSSLSTATCLRELTYMARETSFTGLAADMAVGASFSFSNRGAKRPHSSRGLKSLVSSS
mmetsp:Transcript_7494/g.16259  ORF Transcript_7494/g.16259 Transcript_7494/m.16259 type:complete len:273 (+) Transcript_7494:1463-2281(+)